MAECGFSLEHYRDLVEMYPNALMIHDVDQDLRRAVDLARIDRRCGKTSEFFIRLHAKYYNACSWESRQHIKTILDLNHTVGLHLERWAWDGTWDDACRQTDHLGMIDKRITSNIVSLHEPTKFTRTNIRELQLRGLITVRSFQNYGERVYASDSGGRWRSGCPCLSIDADGKPCGADVILTHPRWWFGEDSAENY